MGRFHESVLQYQELIALDPDNAIWYFGMLYYYKDVNNIMNQEKILKNVSILIQIMKVNGAYAYSLYLNGEYNEALKYIQLHYH